jgi:cell division protein FtsB
MSSFNQQPYTNEQIIEYLLGALPADESERLDELSFTDDEFAGRLQIAENDLLDAYARGELSDRQLEKFNTAYLASPRKREMVRFAKTFLAFVDRPSTLPAEAGLMGNAKAQEPEAGRRWFTIPRWSLQWGLAVATLLLVLIGGYFVVENARLRNQMRALQAEREALQQREQELETELADKRQENSEAANELARVRERLVELERQSANQPKYEPNEPVSPDVPKVATFTLAPPLRGAGQITKLTLPGGTTGVALRLELESNDFPAYRTVLKNPATGGTLWQSGRLKAAGKFVPVRLPADLLQSQNYTLELSGISTSGAAEIVASYTFRVEKP